ncbi:MAG: sulfatase [Fimbriimonadaceae bacterium]|nr:sulfatase [Fimbriimonadaceae bacterium]
MPASDRPNVLFVFADQLRSRDIDHPAHPLLTPAYDRLRAEGTRCVNTVANCPVCTPSRAMLLTGQYPLTNRVPVNDIPLPDDALTIGELTRDAGYRTGYIGKWHLDGVPRSKFTPPGPRRHGFDYWAVHNCIHHYLASSYYRDTPDLLPIPGYEPEFQTDLACDFLAQPSDQPFCLFLSFGPPHNPFQLLPRWYRDLYDPQRLALAPNVQPPDPLGLRDGAPPQALGRLDDVRLAHAQYYGAISALDHQLMRLLEALDASGQAANTIVVYTSDHGEMLWSHGRVRKQQPWDEAAKIPFVVRWPGEVPAGADHPVCFSIADFTPTLLGMLGLEVPATMQGSDLSATLRGRSAAGPRSSFLLDLMAVDEGLTQNVAEWRGVRTARHTYARWADGRPWLLYDNVADPDQLHNLAGSPGHQALTAALEAELQGWLTRTGDGFKLGLEHLVDLGLASLWNARERELHGERGRFLEE